MKSDSNMNGSSRKMLRTSVVATIAVLAVLAVGAVVRGNTINWGNALFDANYNSAGAEFDGATFTFEMGTFSDGFVPTALNTAQWGSEWLALDSTTYDNNTEWFTGSYTIAAGDTAQQGRQAYIWVYNNSLGDETSEWLLFTDAGGGDAWTLPGYTDPLGSDPPGTSDWRVSTADSAVWGGLNGVPGSGTFTGTPGAYAFQTFTFGPAVPEPSSSLLIALGALGLLRRRR